MKLITEMYDNFEVLTECKDGKDLKIKGVFMQAETKNRKCIGFKTSRSSEFFGTKSTRTRTSRNYYR